MNRRGFTLAELLVVVVLLTVITGAIYQSINATQRTAGSLVQRMDVQQSTRTVALYLTNVLRELDAVEGDVRIATATRLETRGMRWTGILCTSVATAPGGIGFVVYDDLFYGLRPPDHRLDSILLYVENDPDSRLDDGWLVGGLRQVHASTCDDGSPGTTLEVRITPASGGDAAALAGVTKGSPVRGFQEEDYTLHLDAGEYWLGKRTAAKDGVWTSTLPIVGPLTSDGLEFTYFDANGLPTATRTAIATIGLAVRGLSLKPVSGTGYVGDSVITRIALRNNARF